MDSTAARPTFKLDIPSGSSHPALAKLALGGLEWFCCFKDLNRIHDTARAMDPARPFADRLLEVLGVSYAIEPADLARIPAAGPALVVANHPTGGAECLILLSLLRKIRPDYKFMANYLLGAIPEFRNECIFVDPMGGRDAHGRNIGPMLETLRHLRKGGMLVVFPAGSVSHYRLDRRAVADGPWEPSIARLAVAGKAETVPVHVSGCNSLLFHAAGLVHPRLRTALLPRELFNKQGAKFELHVGKAVASERLAAFATDAERIAYLRERTLALRHRKTATPAPIQIPRSEESVAPPEPAAVLDCEIRALPIAQRLYAEGGYEVWWARAVQAPCLLREIGRLREIAFRAANEGSGKPLDLDRFDSDYRHLFVWQRDRREVVGAYRVGHADELYRASGELGLYTSTLFRFDPELFRRMCPALELGRSFVRPEYQRSPALMLLWKGIGRYLLEHPRYRYLFGPVSISNAYRTYSRGAIVQFLSQHGFLSPWARLVRPRRSFMSMRQGEGMAGNLEDLSALISDIEQDGKGVPVLLRQYLRLGGKVLGFNVDPDFSWVLDCLIVVDLTQTDRTILRRYIGAEGVTAYLKRHTSPELAGAAP